MLPARMAGMVSRCSRRRVLARNGSIPWLRPLLDLGHCRGWRCGFGAMDN